MGLLDFLFGRRDPAMGWEADPGLKLEVDLTDASLCGVKIGDPIERLSKLGPPENAKPNAQSGYEYLSRGLGIGADEEGKLVYLDFCWASPDRPRYGRFPGTFAWKGKTVPIDGGTTATDLAKRFGEPYHVEDDEDETIVRYDLGDLGWELEFVKDGGLKTFMIDKPGLFADPAMRSKFGITRPWPPLPGQGRPT